MLQWLRKSTKSWFIVLAIGAIVVVFIFWGVGSYRATQAQQAAEVNGTAVPCDISDDGQVGALAKAALEKYGVAKGGYPGVQWIQDSNGRHAPVG